MNCLIFAGILLLLALVLIAMRPSQAKESNQDPCPPLDKVFDLADEKVTVYWIRFKDGLRVKTAFLSQGKYTGSQMASMIQEKINQLMEPKKRVQVSYACGKLTFVANFSGIEYIESPALEAVIGGTFASQGTLPAGVPFVVNTTDIPSLTKLQAWCEYKPSPETCPGLMWKLNPNTRKCELVNRYGKGKMCGKAATAYTDPKGVTYHPHK